jgi:hypothetical protein
MTEFPGGLWTTNAVGGAAGVPALLLHGTDPQLVDAILADGLTTAKPTFYGDGGIEPEAVYLTESLYQARANSFKHVERVPTRRFDAGILVVDVTALPLLALGFYACPVSITADRIRPLAEHPARWRIRRRYSTA